MRGYMRRGPNVALSLRFLYNAKQDLSYFWMWACCPFWEDSAAAQGGRQECQDPRSDEEKTTCEGAGTSGYTYATLAHETHGRVGDEAKEQIKMLADEA